LSVFYAIPTKLFYSTHDPYTIHRVITCVFFAASLVLLALAAYYLGLGVATGAAVIVYLGSHPMLVSNVFQAKLVVTSIAWCSLATLLFVKVEQVRLVSGNRPPSRALKFFALAAPMVSVLSYECYTGTRVLGVGFWGLAFLYVGLTSWRLLPLLGGSTAASLAVLKWMHPGMSLNLGIFAGRGEGPFGSEGEQRVGLFDLLLSRLSECQGYFLKWVDPIHFDSEGVGSHFDQIVVLVVLSILAGIACIASADFRKSAARFRWVFFFTGFLLLGSAVIPLFSDTGVRAHRQFGIYFFLPLLIAVLITLLEHAHRVSKVVFTLAALGVVGFLSYGRIPAVLFWPTGMFLNTEPDLMANFNQLRSFTNENLLPTHSQLRVCDQSDLPHSHMAWNSILYASGMACRLGVEQLDLNCDSCEETPCVRIVHSSESMPLEIQVTP